MTSLPRALLILTLGGTILLSPLRPAAAPQAQSSAAPPRLVVMLVVDQLRSDYLLEYGGRFTGCLQRLMKEGAWFRNGAYPYLNTVTCPGHATIGTGTMPWRHGMILNEWFDRSTGRAVACTDDPTTKEIVYDGGAAGEGDSAKRLLTDTLAEQLRERAKARIVSMSLKPRSAIMMAGPKANAVTWLNERGSWATSTAYSRTPVDILKRFIDQHPIANDYHKVWERSLELAAYQHEDDAVGEVPPTGWDRTFPHPLGTNGGKPDSRFYTHWQRSPFADEYLGRMAAAAVDGWQLGRGAGTDFLGVSFSTLDSVGHGFGPRSHEV
ncbi:MAG TPA: alkaline phosphatase family protein, partial [Vicinamibacterales bacterium]|nr:alkaline phosphatase family protein [Vicinamibacterales bacterium]